jgi:hypothetical protein
MSAHYEMKIWGVIFFIRFLIDIKFIALLHKGISAYAHKEFWEKRCLSRKNGCVYNFFMSAYHGMEILGYFWENFTNFYQINICITLSN